MRTIIFSSILAIAIWALTWGLQHFPDSPDRSAWLVPVWFLVSIYAYLALEKEVVYKKIYLTYALLGFVFFVGLSLVLYTLVQAGYMWGWEHGHGSDNHDSDESVIIEEQLSEWTTSTYSEFFNNDIHFKWDGHTDHSH